MTGTKSDVIYLTTKEYDELSTQYQESELAGSSTSYGGNHPFGEYIRQTLGQNPDVGLSTYGEDYPSIRYTEQVTVEFPEDQYESLREQFRETPVADDVNGRFGLSGNSPFTEYLRRCLRQQLELAQ